MWQEILSHTGARARARSRRVCRTWYLLLRAFIVRVIPEAISDVRLLYLNPAPGFVEMVDNTLLFPAVCPTFDDKAIRCVSQGGGRSLHAVRRYAKVDFIFANFVTGLEIRLYCDTFADGDDSPDPCVNYSTRSGQQAPGSCACSLPLSPNDVVSMSRRAAHCMYRFDVDHVNS